MTRNWQINVGFPLPLGATPTPDGVNFAVFAEHAQQLFLCLFNEEGDELARLPFQEKHRGIWHMEVIGLTQGQHYGLRAEGTFDPANMHFFNSNKLLIDPYAKQLSERLVFHEEQRTLTPEGQPDSRDSAAFVPKSIVAQPNLLSHVRPKKPRDAQRSLFAPLLCFMCCQPDVGVEPAKQGFAIGVPVIVEVADGGGG